MRYKAFLSYKHGDDDALATSLEKALEKFAKPTFKRRSIEIFRDSNDLSAAADLGGKIRNGLETSEYFICMASPKYAGSKWCCREAEYWRDNKPVDNFLILLTDGEILWDESTNDFDWSVTTAIPKELSGVFSGEPFYIDFRNPGPIDQMNLDNPDFKTRLVLLAATLHQKSVGDMVGEAVKQHKRTMRIRNAAVATVMTLMALTIVLTVISNRRKSASILHYQAKSIENTDPTLALRLEQEALKIYDNPDFKRTAFEIINRNSFYRIIASQDTSNFMAMGITKQGMILLASDNGNVSLRNEDGTLINEFITNTKKVNSADFSPDGQSILIGSDEGAHLLDLQGNLISEFKLEMPENDAFRVSAVAFAPSGQMILTGSNLGAHLWDLNGDRIPGFDITGSIKSVAFSPEGNAVLLGYDGSTNAAVLIDLQGVVKATFGSDDANFGEPWTITNKVAFSADGQTIMVCSSVNNIQLFTPEGDKVSSFQLPTLVNFEEGSWTASISPDGTKILTSSFENVAQLWTRQGKLIKEFKGHDGIINLFAFDPFDDQTIFTGSMDKTIRKWYSGGLSAPIQKEFSANDKPIFSVGIAPDNGSILISSGDSISTTWDFNGKLLKKFIHKSKVEKAVFSPDGKAILTRSDDRVKLWDLDGNPLAEYIATDEMISSLSFTSDSESILISFKSNIKPESALPWLVKGIRKWEWKSDFVEEIKLGDEEATSAQFSPDGKTILLSSNGEATLWNLNGDFLQTYKLSDKVVTPVAISPDGASILTSASPTGSSLFNTVYGKSYLWNLQGVINQEFKLNEESVDPIGFSTDGESILTLSYPELNPWDKGSPTARLWDLEGNILLEIQRPEKYISDLAISPDSKFIVVGYRDSWTPLTANLKENKLVIYQTIGLNDFLEKYTAPLSKDQRKKFDVD